MNNVVVSFFKKYNIPYKMNRSNNTVSYPCFYCHEETAISVIRTRWKCCNCSRWGTLVHLIEFINDNDHSAVEAIQQVDIYDEKKEIEDIIKLLAKIRNKELALELQEKLSKILDKGRKKRDP